MVPRPSRSAQAQAANVPVIIAEAQLRRAAIARERGANNDAQKLIGDAIGQPGVSPELMQSANILLARWAQEDGVIDMDAAIASVGADRSGAGKAWITAPDITPPTDAARAQIAELGIDRSTRSSDLGSLGWADVGFDIANDGTVNNVA
jgi:hypothetical protein